MESRSGRNHVNEDYSLLLRGFLRFNIHGGLLCCERPVTMASKSTMNLWEATASGFKRYFDFKGRATRSEFWYFLLFFILAYVVVWLIDHLFLPPILNLKDLPFGDLLPGGYVDNYVGITVLLYRPIMAIPTLSVTVRRLHDVGISGWWCCLWIFPVPLVGWIWLLPWLARPSKDD